MDRNAIARIAGRATVIGLLALVVVACGGAGSSSSTSANTAGPASVGQPPGTHVTVTLTDFHIALSQQTFPPGQYVFVVRNSGQVTHALEITGPGAPGLRTASDIAPGQSADLAATLQAGSYEIICPVDGHKSLGMDVTITVGGAGNASHSAPATTSATSAGIVGY